MKAKKYNEFKVELEQDSKGRYIPDEKTTFKIKRKWATDRKFVSIHDHEADWNNSIMKNTKLYYELVADKKDEELESLKLEYLELFGKKPSGLFKKDTLIKKINEKKSE